MKLIALLALEDTGMRGVLCNFLVLTVVFNFVLLEPLVYLLATILLVDMSNAVEECALCWLCQLI